MSDKRPRKKSKTTPLNNAKWILHGKIHQHPDQRIYQIEHLDPRDPDKTYQPFVIANPDKICCNHILDNETHTNVREYYFSNEQCLLVFDVEWYTPVTTSHDRLFQIVGHLVDSLVEFLTIVTEHEDGVCIMRDDV